MSLGARGGAKGGAKGSGKDRHPEKKDKPQPKEKVKPQATTEQIRLANMIDRKTSDDGADVRKMVQDLMEMTCRTEEEVCSALHDSDNDMVAACNILLETEKTQGEWQTSEKKKKKPPQPLNNGEAAPPRERERGPPGSRPRRGEGERGDRGERGERGERGRGAGRGGRGGGRGGRGAGRGGRGAPRPRGGDRDHSQGHYADTNQMGDAFPATEDWDNEEWSGSLSDTKVFTPSVAAVPPAEPEGAMLPPTEDWDSPPSVGVAPSNLPASDPHIPTYTYHNAAQHHVNLEQLNSGSRASPATPSADQLPPEHYLHQIQHPPTQPMGMSGSLTAAQSQYLSQLTQQSQRDAIVYSSNYGVYGSTDITSQRKPQRARVPPPSKIPSSAVEMPGGEVPGGMFLDVQFGALEPDDPPHKNITQAAPHVAPPPAEEAAPPASAPPPPLVAAQPPAQVYSQHQPMQQLNESLSSVECPSTSQVTVTSEPAVTTNATSSLEKQLSASMKQLSVSAESAAPQHQPYANAHRPKVGVAGPGSVYAAHPPPAVYGASVYAPPAPQVNSTNASLSAAGGALAGGYPSSVTLTQYQPILNSYQQTSSSNVAGVYNNSALYTAAAAPYSYQPQPHHKHKDTSHQQTSSSNVAGVYNNSALYTAAAAPYSYQPQPHHKHKDTSHQYDSNSTGATSSLASTSTTQTSSAKVATSTAPAPAPAPAYAQGALYGSQGYAYDDQLMRSTMPHHMGGYYEVGYGVSGAREGAFGLSAGERFGRTDAASPQQVPAAALPPGYAYFYQPPPPTTYQYGVYPTYGGGSSVGGVGGVSQGKVGNYAQQQQPQYDAQDTYKTGGGYAGSGSKAGGAASSDLTNAMYAKTHVALNKVNSYEKAAFHSGTPPPFSASHLYITAPPHHHHVPPHQMDVRMNSSHNRRQEAGSTGGRASSNKTAHSKPSYSHSYWPPN